MAQPIKPISLSDVHDVYRGSVKRQATPEVEQQKYRKIDRFAREAGHSGAAPNRPQSPIGRKAR